MFKKLFLIIVIILMLLLLLSIFLLKFVNTDNQQIVIEYLNTKYGNGDWSIVSKEEYAFYTGVGLKNWYESDGYRYIVTSSFTESMPFHIYINESNMVTEDCFLPTYYSIKYGLNYEFNTTINEKDKFSELIDKMVYITDYHYPYRDSEWSSSGWYFDRPKCRIDSFLMEGFYCPKSVQESPKKEKLPDIIPNNQRIPELREIIYLVEQFYSSERLMNKNINDDEFYELVFNNKVTNEEIINYISEHITPINGIEIMHTYR